MQINFKKLVNIALIVLLALAWATFAHAAPVAQDVIIQNRTWDFDTNDPQKSYQSVLDAFLNDDEQAALRGIEFFKNSNIHVSNFQRTYLFIIESELLINRKQFSKADYLINIIGKDIEKLEPLDKSRASILLSISKARRHSNYNAKEALSQLRNILSKTDDIVFLSEKARLYGEIGYTLYKIGDNLDEAASNYQNEVLLSENKADLVSLWLHGQIGLGLVYKSKGEYNKAISQFEHVLKFISSNSATTYQRKISFISGNLAAMYKWIGQYDKALKYYMDANAIKTSLKLVNNKYVYYDQIAEVYRLIGEYDEAVRHLELFLSEKPKTTECYVVYKEMALNKLHKKDFNSAIKYIENAISIRQDIGYYNYIGEYYSIKGDILLEASRLKEASDAYKEGLAVAQCNQHSEAEWKNLYGLSLSLYRQGNIEAAITFGKLAIESIQKLRSNVSKLGEDSFNKYTNQREGVYRHLAKLLIEQGRIPEAEHVLELLKERQYFEALRRNVHPSNLPKGRISLTPLETQERLLEQAGAPLATLYAELAPLRQKKFRTSAEELRLKELGKQLETANTAYIQVLNTVVTKQSSTRADARDIKDTPLKGVLKELGKGTVGLYTLYYKDEYTLILVTQDYRRIYIVSAKDLPRKILAFRNTLKDPKLDPRPQAKELLDIILPPKAREELAQNDATTLMWHLDGPLRYLAIPALHDGSRYLVETYRNTTFTTSSYLTITKVQPKQNWQALGFGVSIERTIRGQHFSCLPNVPMELSTVVRADGKTIGIVPGKNFIDNDFSWNSMKESLKQYGAPPLVHIATHFHHEPGNETMSYLVPGAGQEPITLDQLDNQDGLFDGVDLITLSACQTAIGGGKTEGREVDSLSMTAQKLGAKAVIATLWSVADDSTSLLMQQFYRLMADKQLSKAEALRQAQLALLQGTADIPRSTAASAECVKKDRSGSDPKTDKPEKTEAPEFITDKARPYAHPYYWAPFVLMGNWK